MLVSLVISRLRTRGIWVGKNTNQSRNRIARVSRSFLAYRIDDIVHPVKWCIGLTSRAILRCAYNAKVFWFTIITSLLFLLALWLITAIRVASRIRRAIQNFRGVVRRDRDQCPICGYSLRHTASGICPECGTPID